MRFKALWILFLFAGTQAAATPCYVVLLVDAPGLNYSQGKAFLRSMVKHPRDGCKEGTVGHAWILLHGSIEGRCCTLEGGHSGETGWRRPRYLDGIMNYAQYGRAVPAPGARRCQGWEPNPVKYLWESTEDGFFQPGSGGHRPTFAAKVELTQQQFEKILVVIQPVHYDYLNYAITGNQCCTLVQQVGQIVGLDLHAEVSVPIPRSLRFGGETLRLWEDPCYATLTISSPDKLETSLKRAVCEGKAENVLDWYLKQHRRKKCLQCRWKGMCDGINKFPSRLRRWLHCFL